MKGTTNGAAAPSAGVVREMKTGGLAIGSVASPVTTNVLAGKKADGAVTAATIGSGRIAIRKAGAVVKVGLAAREVTGRAQSARAATSAAGTMAEVRRD